MSKIFTDLSVKDAKKLLAIKTGADIKSMRLLNEFRDDHIACASARINGVGIDMFWCGSRVVGALELSDSKKAKEIVAKSLQCTLDGDINGMFDYNDEELANLIKKPLYKLVLEHLRSLRKNNYLRKEVSGMLGDCKVIDQNFNVLV